MNKDQKIILFINQKETIDEDMQLVLKLLQRRYDNIKVIVEHSHKKILQQYQQMMHLVEVMIFDHHFKDGVKLLNKLLSFKKDQKTIILSGSAYCSALEGCEYCQDAYTKMRLLKPISKKRLFDAIESFETQECEYVNRCEVLG